ncbi:Rtf2 RING-finger-domain-containing protein [Gorgonomyces haynaldii]|nr:Rtf2 RING-finger-domain-containing protein [Gorgonomyces haynaldii]
MGCDGGSIPKRNELIKTKKREQTVEMQKNQEWLYCHASKEPLQEPVCSDLVGHLYNKMALLELVLQKQSKLSLAQLVDLKLTKTDSGFICPITAKEMNGNTEFVYLSCGHVMARMALQSDTNECLVCQQPSQQTIVINPTGQDLIRQQELFDLQTIELKKKKKRFAAEKESKKTKIAKSDINMNLPKLEVNPHAKLNRNLQSLYKKRDANGVLLAEKAPNWLSQGTMNRYAASAQ